VTDKTKEPTVTLVGPGDHLDVFDVGTGLRFVQGEAKDVPLSVAEKIERERRGYYIQGALYSKRKQKGGNA
jgi:hypothetical protein